MEARACALNHDSTDFSRLKHPFEIDCMDAGGRVTQDAVTEGQRILWCRRWSCYKSWRHWCQGRDSTW